MVQQESHKKEGLKTLPKYLVVDRIEGDWVICSLEDKEKYYKLPLKSFPASLKEGDICQVWGFVEADLNEARELSVIIDRERTRNKRKELGEKMKNLFYDMQ